MNKKRMHEIIDGSFDELVSGVQKFVRMDSVLEEDKMTIQHPFGAKLTGVLEEFLNYADSMGFRTKNIANAVGYAECGLKDGKLIGILCHLDVVPTGSRGQWIHDPFGAVIEDGKLYGRGSADDKGPTVASLFALKALKECGEPLNYRYRLIVGLDEESGFSRCLNRYLETEETPAYSFSPDAYFPVINAEKGILRFDIEKTFTPTGSETVIEKITSGDRYNVVPDLASACITGDLKKARAALATLADDKSSLKEETGRLIFTVRGKSAHAMEPEKGKNALQLLMKKLVKANLGGPELLTAQKLAGNTSGGEQFGIDCSDDISGPLTCNAAAIDWENGKYRLKFDIRYPVTADHETIMQRLNDSTEQAGAKIDISQNKLPLHLPADLPFIKVLLEAYKSITGEKGKPFSIGGGTYCRFLDNSVSFGPVFPYEEEMAHQPDEFVSVDSLRKMTHIYAEALYKINRMPS